MTKTKKRILFLLSIIIVICVSFIYIKTNYVVIDNRVISAKTDGVYFDCLDEEKAKSLHKLKYLEKIYAATCDVSDIDFLKDLPKLDDLTLDVRNIKDLSPIGCCTELQQLKLIGNDYDNLDSLGNCTKLYYLELHGNKYENLEFLKVLNSLKWLTIIGTGIKDIEPIRQKNTIELLEIRLKTLEDISALSGMENIRWLVIDSNNLSDCSALSTCTGLKTLSLSGCDKLNSLEFVYGLDKLEEIALDGTSVTNFEPLLKLKNLEKVTVSDGQLDEEMIGALKDKGVTVEIV